MCSHHRTEINAKGERVCSTCGHIFAYATFDGWLIELAKVFVEKWDYTPEKLGIFWLTVLLNPFWWIVVLLLYIAFIK